MTLLFFRSTCQLEISLDYDKKRKRKKKNPTNLIFYQLQIYNQIHKSAIMLLTDITVINRNLFTFIRHLQITGYDTKAHNYSCRALTETSHYLNALWPIISIFFFFFLNGFSFWNSEICCSHVSIPNYCRQHIRSRCSFSLSRSHTLTKQQYYLLKGSFALASDSCRPQEAFKA